MIRANPTQAPWAMVVGIADVICVGRSVGTRARIGLRSFTSTYPASGLRCATNARIAPRSLAVGVLRLPVENPAALALGLARWLS